MVDIRPNQLPDAILPLRETDELIVDQGSDGVRKSTPFETVNSVAPVASQSKAVAGVDNIDRMTSLGTKQSIASEVGVTLASNTQGVKADSAVQSVNGKTGNSVTIVKGDIGLGNVDNTSDLSKPISTATQTALDGKASSAQGAKADSAVQSVNGKNGNTITITKADVGLGNVDNTSDANKPVSTAAQNALDAKANSSVTISAGTGMTGGGNLTANRTVSLNAASIASLAKADSAVQSVNGVLPVSGNVTVAAEEKRLQDTRTTAIAESFPSNVQFVETAGYSSVGDGGAALYVRVPAPTILGNNIITNGGFSSDTSWIKGTGWTISGGTANKAVTASQSELGQTATLVAGDIYAVTYTISNYSGSGWVRPYLAYNGTAVIGTQRTSNGTYTDYLTAAPLNGRVAFQAQATVACSIDNVSVRKVMSAFQSADGAWWELRPDVSDIRIVVPNTPDDAIDASKIKLDLRADFSSAVVRILSDKFRDLVSARDFGALGVSNDDTAALQAFLNQVKPIGLKAWVPKGDYGVSATLLLNNQGISGETPGVPLGKNGIYKRTAIVGDGAGSTVFRLVGNINGLHIQTGLGKAHHRGFSIVQASLTDRLGVGLLVDQSQALKFSDIEVKGCFNGITNRDSFSINYDSIDLTENINGFIGENVTSGSHPNAINFNSVRFMDNTGRGCYLTNPTTCNFFGGSFEGNGSGNAINGGLEVMGASNEGAFGINVIGTYFENNFGGFDIRISNSGSGARIVEHRIKGCTFNRISSTRFTTHNIRIERVTSGFQKVIASENSFQGFNTYVPDAGRKYIVNLDSGAGSASVLVAVDNLYGSPLETP